jgi:hypothetical protein
MPLLKYSTGTPEERGVYACRVLSDRLPNFYEDKFLIWIDNQWGYPGSDQNYRGDVPFWLGPLQRKMT